MSHVATSYQMSTATVSVGRRFYPRRYQRFPGNRAGRIRYSHLTKALARQPARAA